jgi:O-antigen/teichoic acid export membrane protein
VIVNKNRPEWRSKATGFGFWAIIGSALTLLLVAGLSWRKRRRDKKSLVVFESCRIKKD